jgi:hypothetical protein
LSRVCAHAAFEYLLGRASQQGGAQQPGPANRSDAESVGRRRHIVGRQQYVDEHAVALFVGDVCARRDRQPVAGQPDHDEAGT